MALPKVIVLATGKGGAGKSTLARCLAGHWLGLGHTPAIVDADPQATIASLHNPDSAMGGVVVREAAEEALVVDAIEELKGAHSVILVDTAGFRNRTTIMAMTAADLVLIPLKAAVEDLREAMETYKLVEEINGTPERVGNPIAARLVLTMTTKGTVIARQIRSEITAARYPLLNAEIGHRVAYPEAAAAGLSPSLVEPEGAAARDIAAVATEIGSMNNER